MRDFKKLHVNVRQQEAPVANRGGPGSTSGSSEAASSPGGPARFPCSKLKLDNLFLQWLSMPESQKLVLSLLEDAKAGRPLHGPVLSGQSSPLSPSSAQALFSASTPPLSPQKPRSPCSPASPSRRPGSLLQREQVTSDHIPPFYFPDGKPVTQAKRRAVHKRIDELFKLYPEGLTLPAVKLLIKDVFELPSVLAYPLFYKLVAHGAQALTRDAVLEFIQKHNVLQADREQRLFDVLRQEGAPGIRQEDLKSMMAGILACHPGLEFLHDTPEFQDRYAETVIYRIFYQLDRGNSGLLSLRDLRRGDLLEALGMLDDEEDINKVLKYFSYECFYVIYCKFWELDSDHDFLISKDDLLRYGNHSLTYRIIDRIFTQALRAEQRPQAQQQQQRQQGAQQQQPQLMMGYEDFVYFILSEEDKSNDLSLEYWFRCCDLDCDGRIRPNEMLYFYEEQLHRMECLSQEPVLFEDVLCQVHDMIQPASEGVFTLRDLKRHKALSGTLFNMLFNLNKFVAFETRDPFLVHKERDDKVMSQLSDWDKFAKTEYLRLALEEEGQEPEQPQNASEIWSGAEAF